MIHVIKRLLVFLVVVSIVAVGLPRPQASADTVSRGSTTASRAASMPAPSAGESPLRANAVKRAAAAGEPVLAFGALTSVDEPDTTEFEFPDDGREHLVRDITVWVIASAFVAFFIIKVFLEEDEEDVTDDSPPGKRI